MTQEGTAVFCPHCEAYQTDHPPRFTGAHGESGRLVCVTSRQAFRWEAKVATVFVTQSLAHPPAEPQRAAS